MGARKPPHPGWVTVAQAAEELTRTGDTIDASNVSRYLARNDEVPSEKHGKFRWVDLAQLKAHRASSVFVGDKREARDLGDLDRVRTAVAPSRQVDLDDDTPDRPGSPMAQAKLEAQLLDLKRKRREDDLEDGRLVPAEDVQTVVTAMMGAFVAELARQETALSAKFGADVGVAVRKAHREARAKAAERLKAAAEENLKPAAIPRLDQARTTDVAAA